MKKLVTYIHESRGVAECIIPLAQHIYNILSEIASGKSKEYSLQEILSDIEFDDESYITIKFDDVANFDNDKLMLYSLQDDDEFKNAVDCDFMVALEKQEKQQFGSMDTEKPILHMNVQYIKSERIFTKNKSEILDTLQHELTHYVQYQQTYIDANGNKQRRGAQPYHRLSSKTIYDARRESIEWNTCAVIIDYALQKEERGARISGMYLGLKNDYAKEYRKFVKKTKSKDKQQFFDYIINKNNSTLFLNYIDMFNNSLKQDTYDNFVAASCSDDKYPTQSIIFIILYLMDHSTSKISFPVPSKQNYVANITTEAVFDHYRNKCIKYVEQEYKDYKNKLDKMLKKLDSELNV